VGQQFIAAPPSINWLWTLLHSLASFALKEQQQAAFLYFFLQLDLVNIVHVHINIVQDYHCLKSVRLVTKLFLLKQ
jgi:hypothetical protein